jgi:hypothetical protein
MSASPGTTGASVPSAGDMAADPPTVETADGALARRRGTLLGRWASSAFSLPRRSRIRRDTACLGYGVLVAAIAVAWMWRALPAVPTLMGSRHLDLVRTLAAARQGHGPLVGALPGNGFYPSGIGDDVGIALLFPKLASLLGTQDVDFLVKLLYVVAAAVMIAAYPLIVDRLFGVWAVTLLAPPLAAVLYLGVTEDQQFYWIPGWVLMLGLPCLMVSARRWRSRWVPSAGVLALMLFASLANLLRAGSGVGLLLGFGVVVLLYEPRWARKATCFVAAALVYVGVSTIILQATLSAREANMQGVAIAPAQAAVLGSKDFSELDKFAPKHPTWHALYLGLGYEDNPFGFRFLDRYAYEYVQSVQPDAPFASKAYEAALRDRFLEIARSDPGFVLTTTFHKSAVVLRDGLRFSGYLPLLLLPVAMLWGPLAAATRRRLLIAAPAVAVTFAAPALVVPDPQYEVAWKIAAGFVVLLCVCSIVASIRAPVLREVWARARNRSGLPRGDAAAGGGSAWAHSSAGARGFATAWLMAVGLCVLLVSSAVASRTERSVFYRQNAADAQPVNAPLGPAFQTWSFRDGVPSSWERLSDNVVSSDGGGLVVKTSTLASGYQIGSSPARYTKGKYVAVVRGRVLRGGMTIGVLNDTTDRWIALTPYATPIGTKDPVQMSVAFSLPAQTRIRVMLTNWAPNARSSVWQLLDASIRRPTD